jgi:hypothetical protein
MTPAAVIAIAAGTALLFAREVFEPWMLAKLTVVGAMVSLHAWQGVQVTRMGETGGQHPPPRAALPLLLALGLPALVLLLVLAKPMLEARQLPVWLTEPRYRGLPLGDVPASDTPTR